MISLRCSFVLLVVSVAAALQVESDDGGRLRIAWTDGFLTIRGQFPGGEVRVQYLEAYCRPGSADRDWQETVIPHQTELLDCDENGQSIRLRDRLSDGATVEHSITAGEDYVQFCVTAKNTTAKRSDAHWAQPCVRVHEFTGCTTKDARSAVPEYAKQCFVLLDGQPSWLPTQPWALRARYIPGQVYRAPQVDPQDVNPRPLSELVPSHGLIGCLSQDKSTILAVAWEPYQELFQGVITCIHSDFRIGGLEPGETKRIRGKIYIVDADLAALMRRFEVDFADQLSKQEIGDDE